MIELRAQKRDIFGKKLRIQRAAGLLPVVVYGSGEKATSLFVDTKEFLKVWKSAGESSIVSLNMDDSKKDVLVQEVSLHNVTGSPVHADFYMVKADQLIRVSVPIRFEGVAPAVKTFGGVLVKVIHEVEVEALPVNLPHEFVIDVSKIINLEDQIVISDIKVLAEVKIMAQADDVVALVSVGKEEVEEELAPVDLSKIEVLKKGKKPGDLDEAGLEVTAKQSPLKK